MGRTDKQPPCCSRSCLMLCFCTCDMLRLHGACFHQEGLSSLERHDRLTHQPALLLAGVTAAATVVQLNDLLEVSAVGWDAVLVHGGLDAVYNNRAGNVLCWVEHRCTGGLQVSRSCREIRGQVKDINNLFRCLQNQSNIWTHLLIKCSLFFNIL